MDHGPSLASASVDSGTFQTHEMSERTSEVAFLTRFRSEIPGERSKKEFARLARTTLDVGGPCAEAFQR